MRNVVQCLILYYFSFSHPCYMSAVYGVLPLTGDDEGRHDGHPNLCLEHSHELEKVLLSLSLSDHCSGERRMRDNEHSQEWQSF